MKSSFFPLALLPMLLVAWSADVSAANNNCVGCACKLVLVTEPCGTEANEGGADELESTMNGDTFVCWLEGEEPDAAELEAICVDHCAALPTPPPGPCVGNEKVSSRFVVEQRIGPCETFCPPDESGACDDGINNDAFLDELTDCADPDCFGEAVCRAAVPTASNLGLGALLVALFSLGAIRLIGAARSD